VSNLNNLSEKQLIELGVWLDDIKSKEFYTYCAEEAIRQRVLARPRLTGTEHPIVDLARIAECHARASVYEDFIALREKIKELLENRLTEKK